MDLRDLLTLAKTIWGEARGEPFEGKVAVAWVAINRHESGRWYSAPTLADTCTMRGQFSCWNPDDPNRWKLEALDTGDLHFVECIYVAAGVLCGRLPSNVGMSTHYLNPAALEKMPAWARGRKISYKIGRHQFFEGVP